MLSNVSNVLDFILQLAGHVMFMFDYGYVMCNKFCTSIKGQYADWVEGMIQDGKRSSENDSNVEMLHWHYIIEREQKDLDGEADREEKRRKIIRDKVLLSYVTFNSFWLSIYLFAHLFYYKFITQL